MMVELKDALKAVDNETELPCDMPNDLFTFVSLMVLANDREGIASLFRDAVRSTKASIRRRVEELERGERLPIPSMN